MLLLLYYKYDGSVGCYGETGKSAAVTFLSEGLIIKAGHAQKEHQHTVHQSLPPPK